MDSAKETADRIDSEVYLDILKEAGERLDKEPIPLIGRYWWNPETNKVEPVG